MGRLIETAEHGITHGMTAAQRTFFSAVNWSAGPNIVIYRSWASARPTMTAITGKLTLR